MDTVAKLTYPTLLCFWVVLIQPRGMALHVSQLLTAGLLTGLAVALSLVKRLGEVAVGLIRLGPWRLEPA